MDKGKILVGRVGDNYVIKMVGDVRMNLCTSLNDYINSIFKEAAVRGVLVDLRETSGLDSTTLGLLAKLALFSKRLYNIVPLLFCGDKGILKTLQAMSLDELFQVVSTGREEWVDLRELPCVGNEVKARADVLEAHKLLTEINPQCEADFVDLIHYLEETIDAK